jgi:hypothetical protein
MKISLFKYAKHFIRIFFAFITLLIGIIEQCDFKKIAFSYVKNKTLNAKNGIFI